MSFEVEDLPPLLSIEHNAIIGALMKKEITDVACMGLGIDCPEKKIDLL